MIEERRSVGHQFRPGRRVLVTLVSCVLALGMPACSGTVTVVDASTGAVGAQDTTVVALPTPVDTTTRPNPTMPTDTTPASPLPDSLTTPIPTPDSAATPAGPSNRPPAATPDTVITPPKPPVAAELVSLRLSATATAVTPGASQLLTVTGRMSDGSTAATPPVSWSAQGGAVSTNGLFTAGSGPGTASVTARSGAVSASIALNITSPPEPLLNLNAAGADDFVNSIGVNIHLGYWDTPYGAGYQSIIKPRLLELGVRHARDVGTVVSDDSWMGSVYGRMRELAANGIKFDLVMLPAQGVTDYTALSQWSRLMGFVGNAVESFEGLNEHDLSGRPAWVSETRSFQAALFAAARSDPRTAWAPVLGPSMGHAVNGGQVGSLAGMMDVGNLHPYPGGTVPLANLSSTLNFLAPVDGSHPVIVTETGYHTAIASNTDHPAVSEAAMARYVPRLLLDNFAAGIAGSYLYELIDEGTSLANREQNFGLLRNDGSPKPAYTALKNLMALLNDPGGSGARGVVSVVMGGDTAGVSRLAFVKRDGRQYIVLWQDVPSYNLASRSDIVVPSRTITFHFASSTQVAVYNPLASASPVSSQRLTTLTLPVADSPMVVEITR
jgi:hypothetical protein